MLPSPFSYIYLSFVMKPSSLLLLTTSAATLALAGAGQASAASSDAALPFPQDPAPTSSHQPSNPNQGYSTSASDLQQKQTSEVNGDAYAESTSVNQASYYNRNNQYNYSSAPSYTQVDNIRYETASFYINGGMNGRTGYSENDYHVEVGVRIPLGGRLAKRLVKERAQRAFEVHCVTLANSGWITEECSHSGLQKIAKAPAPAPAPPAVHIPVQAPPAPPTHEAPAPIPGLW